jgi:predicted amidohydrolase YtcJ
MLGESQHYINLEGCFSMSQLLGKLRSAISENTSLPVYIGYNWDQSKLGELPTKEVLDSLATDKPVRTFQMFIMFDI